MEVGRNDPAASQAQSGGAGVHCLNIDTCCKSPLHSIPDITVFPNILGLQVTRHNLQELMPTIRDAIDHASFVAVDCEMTGLFDYEPKPWYLDDMQTRYEDVCGVW